ncbi:HK97-gp10 family putative phage morphogenesis protein [Candidatus Thiothrix sp. Deng01]|uniref:HK97-gp10 family putative phage morphogenesis protein n=1 Tax=Candidatus Thiothrix phosphatis TaxID=3112415 RepID=A0ABU6CWK0_9GAMM|nr:HK97-gp10 family putative phage morphogenesis protein [Candidatus Thiothrix sp. Deng01]MEB4590494.1 HK97-gp10 family putative phage morphogenesis protein [Candidatus Thiothrix sp. Deng01]
MRQNDGIDIEIQGDRALTQALDGLQAKISKRIVRQSARAGAAVFAKRARALAPRDTSQLSKSIRTKQKPFANRMGFNTWVYVDSRAWYAHMVEFGTQPHAIQPRNKKALSFGGKMYRGVMHPGAAAKPFMRPAANEGAAEAFTAVQEKMKLLIAEAVRL